jgi:hypothetical protein
MRTDTKIVAEVAMKNAIRLILNIYILVSTVEGGIFINDKIGFTKINPAIKNITEKKV